MRVSRTTSQVVLVLVFILLSALTVWQLYDTKAELNRKLSAEHV